MSVNHAEILKQFLIKCSQDPTLAIEKLYIEECTISDRGFSLILEGLMDHKVQEIVYINNEFGEKSLNSFLNIINNVDIIRIKNPLLIRGM